MAQNAEILHLHWIAYLADYPSFFESVPRHTPIVWTLHDMNPFTGGCHFTSGCQRFRKACGNCPQVCNPSDSDISAHSLAVKRAALEGRTIHVVAPSQWMLDLARRSPVWPAQTSFTRINYGVDLQQYCPSERAAAKISLGIEPDATVIGFGADNIRNPRKGFELLRAALESRRHDNRLTAVVFGHGDSTRQTLSVSKVINRGYVADVSDKVSMINACDMFVVPSLEDNQPQMAIEAMGCGVPVIGFDSGGIGEMFRDGYEGQLVPRGDVAALAEAIDWMAAHPESAALMGRRSRLRANQDYNAPVQARAYLDLYRQIAARLPLVNRSAA
jgi:glycosyltransferase involved in cell wall biosynthesis